MRLCYFEFEAAELCPYECLAILDVDEPVAVTLGTRDVVRSTRLERVIRNKPAPASAVCTLLSLTATVIRHFHSPR